MDEILAASLVKEQFGLTITSIHNLGPGWDNDAFQINDEYVFRFPRRQSAIDSILRESAILPQLAHQLPYPIPNEIFSGQPTHEYPMPFQGYRHIPGLSSSQLTLSMDQRRQQAQELAHFLKKLHSIPIKPDWKHLLPIGENRLSGSFRHCMTRMESKIGHLTHMQVLSSQVKFESIIALAQSITPPNHLESLVHGDLHSRHIIIDDGKLSGIIDWGDMHIGDPAIDLAFAYYYLPKNAHESFIDKYGSIDESMWLRAKMWALYKAISILEYSSEANLRDIRQEKQMALEFIKLETNRRINSY